MHTWFLSRIVYSTPIFFFKGCPEFIPATDRCEEVLASMGLFLDEEDAAATKEQFEVDLNSAILDQELQDALDQVNPDSPAYVVTGMDSTSRVIGNGNEDPDVDLGLSSGAIGGLVAVGLVGVIFVSAILVRQGRRQSEMYLKQNESVDVEEIRAPQEEVDILPQKQMQSSNYAENIPPLAAPSYDHSEPEQQGGTPQFEVPPALATQQKDRRSDESSNAGSSGWSSQGGLSSLDTSSVDDDIAFSGTAPTTLSDIGASSSISQATSQDDTTTSSGIQMTFSELDDAIQKGDWAAVGVTAALLASQSYDNNPDAEVADGKLSTGKGTLNPARAAELDRLVETGDWEGVVRAAAKYDAQESFQDQSSSVASSSRGDSRRMSAGSSSVQSSNGSTGTGPSSANSGSGTAGSGTARSAFTSAGGTTNSDTNSRARKLDEIRTEIENLVQHVVPEEYDNIDEMMLQFRGREEELVETLRSMQERQVAQKARLEGQKRAKRDAKAIVESKYAEEEQQPMAVDNTGSPADENWMREIEDTPATEGSRDAGFGRLGIDQLEPPQEEDEDKETEEMQVKLRAAIEDENWDVVAETASGLSDRLGDDASNVNDQDDEQEINALVDKGDWEGVVAAASRYGEAGRTKPAQSPADERRARRQRRSACRVALSLYRSIPTQVNAAPMATRTSFSRPSSPASSHRNRPL